MADRSQGCAVGGAVPPRPLASPTCSFILSISLSTRSGGARAGSAEDLEVVGDHPEPDPSLHADRSATRAARMRRTTPMVGSAGTTLSRTATMSTMSSTDTFTTSTKSTATTTGRFKSSGADSVLSGTTREVARRSSLKRAAHRVSVELLERPGFYILSSQWNRTTTTSASTVRMSGFACLTVCRSGSRCAPGARRDDNRTRRRRFG
jgi:hypothetical protein